MDTLKVTRGGSETGRSLSLVLKKHVGLIHISGTLSLLQHKVVNVLHLNAYDNLLTQRVHEIPISALSALAGFNSNDVDYLADAVAALQTTLVRFAVLEPGGSGQGGAGGKRKRRSTRSAESPFIGQGTLIAWAEFQNGMCRYSYIEQMAEHMYNPEVYASIDVGLNRDISSGFAIRLYENTVRYRNLGCTSRDPHFWSTEVFREIMGATSPAYDDFRNLRRKVVEPAVREVNELSDILVEPEYRHASGRGRPVTGIRFRIRDNPQRTLIPLESTEATELRSSDPVIRLVALGLSERVAIMAAQRDPQWALNIAATVEAKQASGAIQKSTAAYARALIDRLAVVDRPAAVDARPAPASADDQLKERRQREKAEREHHAQYQTAVARLGDEGVARFRAQYLDDLRRRRDPDYHAWDSVKKRWIGAFPTHRFEIALVQHVGHDQ